MHAHKPIARFFTLGQILLTNNFLPAQNDWPGYLKLNRSGYYRQRSNCINYMITPFCH